MEKFLALADTKSFSAAARRLRVTQPAITLAVASLEHSLNCKLVARNGAHIELTHEGNIVADTARHMRQTYSTMEAQLHNAADSVRRIGVIDTVARLLFPPEPSIAKTEDEIRIDNSTRIIDWVAQGIVDTGIITAQSKALGRRFHTIALNPEPFVLVHAKPHAITDVITDWLACNADSTSFAIFSRALKDHGITATPILYCTSMELLLDLARAGKGTALLPKHMAEADIASSQLHPLAEFTVERPLWLISRRGSEPHYLNALAADVNARIISA